VRTAFLDRREAIAQLQAMAEQLTAADGRVRAVALFGSLARGQALPSSDADILVLLESHEKARWFDRIPEYAEAFSEFGLPVEAFPYTSAEIRRLLSTPGFLRSAIRDRLHLAGDPAAWQALIECGMRDDSNAGCGMRDAEWPKAGGRDRGPGIGDKDQN
jgi:predicted nucleotidyltransferase